VSRARATFVSLRARGARASAALGLAVAIAATAGACTKPATRKSSAAARAKAAGGASARRAPDAREPKFPPAPRHPRALPSLPDLPPLALQDREDMRHTKPMAGEFPCGGVDVGGKSIPVLCLEDPSGAFDDAATALLPYNTIRAKSFRLPAYVDHRSEGTEGIVRAQGSAPTCSAFALAAAADHSVARWTGVPVQTSVMQIWSRYHRTAEFPAMKTNLEQPLASESSWPYQNDEAASWMSAELCKSWHVTRKCGVAPDPSRSSSAAARPVAEVRKIEVLRPPADVDVLRAKIAAGQDVVVGLKIGHSFAHTRRASNASYVPDYNDATGGHYLVLAGYVTFPKGAYFLAHNSWGDRWGDAGYAWIHEATLQKNVREAYVVDAQPVDASARARRWHVHEGAACKGAEVPDSISGRCARRCADGSPRHGDVCPVASQCADGFVNLTGTCVLAAPRATGKSEDTGVSWSCGPGGCAYTVPDSDACKGDACQISCPAPDFRVAHDKHGLTCIE
jgi:C1A family cysteine protease